MSLVVHVERVERLRRLVGGAEELADVVDLAVSEVVVEEQVEHVLAVATTALRDNATRRPWTRAYPITGPWTVR